MMQKRKLHRCLDGGKMLIDGQASFYAGARVEVASQQAVPPGGTALYHPLFPGRVRLQCGTQLFIEKIMTCW